MSDETKLIPFDINKLKTHEVLTRSGCKVQVLCHDRPHAQYPIVALLFEKDTEHNFVYEWMLSGKYDAMEDDAEPHDYDLFMRKNTKKLWANWVKRKDGSYWVSDAYPSIEALECCESVGDRGGIFSFEIEENE